MGGWWDGAALPSPTPLPQPLTNAPRIKNGQVDLKKVNMDIIKRWITEQLAELVGVEDEVTIMMVINYLESVSFSI